MVLGFFCLFDLSFFWLDMGCLVAGGVFLFVYLFGLFLFDGNMEIDSGWSMNSSSPI